MGCSFSKKWHRKIDKKYDQDSSMTPLMAAAKAGDCSAVEYLIQKYPGRVRDYSHENKTALCYAISKCGLPCVKAIIKSSYVEALDCNFVRYAMDNKCISCAVYMIGLPQMDYTSCIWDILDKNSAVYTRALINRDDFDPLRKKSGHNMLEYCAYFFYANCINELKTCPALLNCNTPLFIAIVNKDNDLINCIIKDTSHYNKEETAFIVRLLITMRMTKTLQRVLNVRPIFIEVNDAVVNAHKKFVYQRGDYEMHDIISSYTENIYPSRIPL